MPLFGKIVIIKRNGTDGTEFPLTTACLFGRKLDCDIRIQIPQVSKEQCRIEQNENKELILTNLSSVNPTRVNGEIVQQSERLKHGDLITIIDRSFRFECPPPPTPKKERLSTNENGEAVKVLQDQQVRSSSAPTDKKKVEHTFDSCLKDGSNLSPALDQSVEVVKGDGSQPIKSSSDGSKSPFYELYNMVKQDLATRSPRRAKAPPSTPLSRPRLNGEEPEKALDAGAATLDKNEVPVTPKHGKKKRRSSVTGATSGDEGVPPLSSAVVHPAEGPPTGTQAGATTAQDSTTKPRRSSSGPATPVPLEGNASLVSLKNTRQATPRKFSETPKSEGSGVSRPQSRAATPERPPALPSTPRPRAADVDQAQTPPTGAGEPEPKQASRTSPRTNAGKRFQIQDMLREFGTTAVSEDKGDVQSSRRKHKMADLPIPVSKRKRVSFGGQLSPELFDKRLPPNSPLRRGATPGRRSLSISQKPQSLLRRASTIGLMSFRLDKAVPKNPAKSASPKRASSPGKKSKVTSPAKASSPAKKAPSPKARTPSPKGKKSPSRTLTPSSGPAMPKTPNSTRRSSDALAKTSNEGSLIQTPATQGRFSVSRVSTPSPISDHGVEAKGEFMCVSAVPDARMTPSLSLRRTSMKASARKTPRSALKSVFDVMRSRRSGASRANLKVISSWADIVKFGQVKVQTEDASKKSVPKRKASKQTKVTQTQTPVRRLKDDTSTGHADSPATVVIGKAYTRSTQLAGAAPKVVSNVALFAKDRKMNEDFTGVAEIFKTPANSKGKGVVGWVSEYPETPSGVSFSTVTEISMMSTPEESGVMMVSPMSVASTAELGRYNSEAVSRLLQDNQDASLIQQDSPQTNGSNDLPASEVISALEMTVEEQTEAEPQTVVQTPLQKPAPSGCLTGVKKLMTTPKQRAEPIEDLRGRLLRTPKEPKAPLEESLEGVKELLTTPKQKGTDLEEMTGLNILQKTPKVKSSPIECAAGFSRLKIPKDKTEKEEDLTGVEQLMRTPKSKGEPVEKAFGLKRLMKTPKQKNKPVEEDLTGIQQMMKTPKQKNKPVEEDLTGIQQMTKTPKQKNKPVEEDLTGIQQMTKTPKQKNKPVEEDLTGIQQMMKTPKQRRAEAVENFTEPAELNQPKSTSNMTETEHDLSSSPKIEEPLVSVASGALDVNCGDQECEDEENVCLPEDTRRESEAAVAIQDVSQIETEKGAETTPRTIAGQSDKENEVISVETSSCEEEGSAREPPVEAECTSQAGDATPSLVALKQVGRSRNVNKTPRGTRAKAAQKPQQCGHADAVSGKYEHASVGAVETAPALRGKGGEGAVKLLESTPLSTPARKSSRGRIPKRHFEETVTVVLKSTQESADGERDSECLPAAKGRGGRNAKRDVKVEPVLETKVAADLTAAEPAEAGASEKLPARVAKGKRGQRAKEESENSPLAPTTQEPQGLNVPETVVVEADMAPECGELQSLAEPNTKPRRGRRTKKEPLKAAAGEETTKSTPASVEADSSDVPVSGHAQTSAVKPGRGRRVKPGALMDQVATAEPEEVAELVAADPVAADPVAVVQPPARSSRRTKSRALKTQSDDQNEPSTMFAEPGQNAEATVKNTRGGRRVKQPKAYSLEDTQDETKGNPQVECETVAQVEAPTIKSGRGQRVAAARDGMGGPVKRGRHAAAIAKVSPAVKSTRARKTAVKIEDAPVPEEPVRETITPVPQMGPGGAEDTGSVVADKKRRGRMAKKAKVSSEDDPVVEAEELITAKESENRKTTKKNVNWNSDLVCWRNIEEVELPGAKEECKQMSKKKAVPVATAVESIASETKRPEDPPADNRRQEVPAAKQFAEVDAPRVRRGRAPASKPDDDVARVKRGHNRKATEAAADDLPIAEPSPGTKAGKAATGVPRRTRRGAAAKQVAEAPEAEAAQRQPVANDNASKPARGRRKAPQDGGAQVPTKEATPRRGTRVQKPADRAESAAPPPKRTRRK